jgi:aspartyl-tRNA(Asn)/glutamyl-tRNA(Gln) amidotransferase subunit A
VYPAPKRPARQAIRDGQVPAAGATSNIDDPVIRAARTPAFDPFMDAVALAAAIRGRRVSPVEVVEHLLRRIAAANPALNAYLAVFGDQARAAAARAERAATRRAGHGPLHGVPVSVKDIVLTTEAPTTAGSRVFGAGITTARDAPVVRRLRRAGAIILGKTNLHEVALGVTSANEHFGPARNPWDTSRIAGGSSGGSAVAVAAGLGPLSLGSDTRGSIRIPAACCGITGLKPTQGLLPLDGVVPLSPSLDHVGPMARTAADCALMLGAMAGGAVADRCRRALARRVRGVRVGVPEFYLRDLDGDVQRAVEAAIAQLRRLGARPRTVAIPELEAAHAASVPLSATEAVAFHDAYLRERPEAYGPLVRERLQKAYQWSALEFLRAQEARRAVGAAFARVFDDVDCLVGAVVPVPAPPIGAATVRTPVGESGIVDAFTRCNSPQNMGGIPALSLPCGATRGGLPIGWQIMAARGRDDLVLGLGAAYQRATDWHERRPAAFV